MTMTLEKLNALKTIKEEYLELSGKPIENIGTTIGLVDDDDIFLWKFTLTGPKDSSYAGGIFRVRIQFPDNYPKGKPEVYFKTPIYHLNINPRKFDRQGADKLGHVSLNTINQWVPERKIREVIIDIFSLLYAPNPDSPYGLDRADEMRYNKAVYEEKIKYFTKKYADPSSPNNREYDNDWDFSFP